MCGEMAMAQEQKDQEQKRRTQIEFRLRPYDVESTTSHLNREVKLRTASIVLWWGTTREVLVL